MDQQLVVESTTLLDREHEVERVRTAVRAAGQRAGGVLAIEGPPGIGKSRLLLEAKSRAQQRGLQILTARATELEQGYPFGVVRQLFERALLESDDEVRERWLSGAAALAADVLGVATTAAAPATSEVPATGDPGYARQHGLYWLASNISSDAPLVLLVDDLQWCDVPSARALTFIARRLTGQSLALIVATRPSDPTVAPEVATLLTDPATELLRPLPLTRASVAELIRSRLGGEPHDRFVDACIDVTGGNPFLIGELLDEVAARGIDAGTPAAAAALDTIVPRGVANTVLLRLARIEPPAGELGRALSVLGDGAQVGDAARLAQITGSDLEPAMASLVSAGVIEPGGVIRFTHPILRTAIYGDLSAAERERLHCSASKILQHRGAPTGQIAAHLMQTEPGADLEAVSLLRHAARDALGLGDAAGAAALLARALNEPPAPADRGAVVLELGQALARAGAPRALAPLSEIVAHSDDEEAIVAAAIELSGMLFFAGRPAEGAAILHQAQQRVPPDGLGREQLDVALLGASYTSLSARRAADPMISQLRDPGGPARGMLEATTLGILAMDEAMYMRSAATARDLGRRALAAGLPLEPHRGGNWAILALAALALSDDYEASMQGLDAILAQARRRGVALTVANVSALRALVSWREGDLNSAEADAQAAIELAPDLLGVVYVVPAVATAVLVGLDRDETPESLRQLIDRSGIRYDTEFLPSSQLRFASGVLRAAAGNHAAAVEELRSCELEHPTFGGENPAVVPWRSFAALSLSELGRHEEARALAAEEVRRAQAFGALRPIGMALRAQALVGPSDERSDGLREAMAAIAQSGARLEHARILLDVGAMIRASGQRAAAREPLLEALTLASRCGALRLERRARAELAAIGVRPGVRNSDGAASLTPSERRVVELAAAGGTNREIAQTLFVTEKTVETHLGRAFRKLNVSSRRQLRDVLVSDTERRA
ncbi:MAG: helix-turn-helix transcriptional regulator [Solirubrobacteraceae bacterium]